MATPAEDPRQSFNEDRRRVFAESSREIVFVCECSDPDCRFSVVLTPEGYDRARREPPHLLLCDQHADAPS